MNWIEIDKILHGMLARHTDIQSVYAEAQKLFKWNSSQARAAIDPLAKRANFFNNSATETVAKTTQKRKTVAKRKTKS
jgi:hypothetical protein